MRRIFTSVIAIVCLITASINASAQNCTNTQETFLNVNGSSQGFIAGVSSGTGSYTGFGAPNNTDQLEIQNISTTGSATFKITSPTYSVPNLSTTIDARATIGSGAQFNITSVTVAVRYVNNLGQITETTPVAYVSGTCVGLTKPSDLSTTGWSANNYQIVFYVTGSSTNNGNNGSLIFLDTFGTNGTSATIVLPVRFAGLEGKTVGSSVNLKWNVDVELNVNSYLVEKSVDGVRFSTIGTVAATGQRTYTYTDLQASASAYYRIKSVDVDGKLGYSTVINVRGNSSSVIIKAFLSNAHSLTVQYDGETAGRISVSTADGRMVKNVTTAAGSQQSVIDLSSVQSGLLLVRFENASGVGETIKVIKP
jgi:hypothetical protein